MHSTIAAYMPQMDNFVTLLTRLAQCPHHLNSSYKNYRLNMVALGGIKEFVRWMSRTKFISNQLLAIIDTVLDNLEHTTPDGEGSHSISIGSELIELEELEPSKQSRPSGKVAAGTLSDLADSSDMEIKKAAMHEANLKLLQLVAQMATTD
eukprot:6584648-Pyramimonas_sp.AAC.1